ncbi:MAG: hypothetical protein KQH53_14610 [Desulfarculaceae bacterium]|nr:hypothetical protein [Desulfarculaceae bacterium]
MPKNSQTQTNLPPGHGHAQGHCGCAGDCANCTCRQKRASEDGDTGA